tara:strand:+ start:1842 stop:2450 length:609 start_codon:yes stop_codon:yes gene_type:complete
MDNQTTIKKYPFNFNVELISNELDFWVYKKDYQKALDILEDVELKWFRAKSEGGIPSGQGFEHLEQNSITDLFKGGLEMETGESSEYIPDTFAAWIDGKIKFFKDLIEQESLSVDPNLQKDESDRIKHSGATRYLILDEFFELKKEFKELSQKNIIKLLAIILEKDVRTAKGYKNGEQKYVGKNSEEEAIELINKIKKGDFL